MDVKNEEVNNNMDDFDFDDVENYAQDDIEQDSILKEGLDSDEVVKEEPKIKIKKGKLKGVFIIVYGNVFSNKNKVLDDRISEKNAMKISTGKTKKEKKKKKADGSTDSIVNDRIGKLEEDNESSISKDVEKEPTGLSSSNDCKSEDDTFDKTLLDEQIEKNYLEIIGSDIAKKGGCMSTVSKRKETDDSISGKYQLRLSGDNLESVKEYLKECGYPEEYFIE